MYIFDTYYKFLSVGSHLRVSVHPFRPVNFKCPCAPVDLPASEKRKWFTFYVEFSVDAEERHQTYLNERAKLLRQHKVLWSQQLHF